MTDRGHNKDNFFAKDGVIGSGKFIAYEVSPTFTDAKQLTDKNYVDTEITSSTVWTPSGDDLIPVVLNTSLRLEEDEAYYLSDALLDQIQNTVSFSIGTTGSWQSITAGRDGHLYFMQFNNSNAIPQVNTIIIYDGNGTGGTLLATFNNVTLTGTLASFTLPTPLFFNEGQQFTVQRFFISGGAGTIAWSYTKTDAYPGGQSSLSSAWDFGFRTYVYEHYMSLTKNGIKTNNDIVMDANDDAADSDYDITNSSPGFVAKFHLNETGDIRAIVDNFTTPTANQLVDALTIKNEIDAHPGTSLSQDKIFYFAEAGNDSNNGLSMDTPFETMASARTAAIAAAPSSANPVLIYGVSGKYTENIVLQNYMHLDTTNIDLTGSITVTDFSNVITGNLTAPTTTDSILKTSGTAQTSIKVRGKWNTLVGYGVRCTSGGLDVEANNITYSTNFIRPGSTGNINLKYNSAKSNGVNPFINYNSSGTLNIDCNETVNTSSGNLFNSTGANFINIKANKLKATSGKVYEILSGPVLVINVNELKEGATSTKTSANAIVNITRNNADKMELVNDVSGTIIGSSGSGNITEFTNEGIIPLTHKDGLNEFTSHPLFGAYASTNKVNVTGGGFPYTIIFDTETKDRGGNYDHTTGIFTAPFTAWYLFTIEVELTGIDIALHSSLDLRIETNAAAPYSSFIFAFKKPSYTGSYVKAGSFLMPLTATNTVKGIVNVGGSSLTVSVRGVGGNTKWSGMLWGV